MRGLPAASKCDSFFISAVPWIRSPRLRIRRDPPSATRNALARVRAGTSLDPCQGTGVTSVPSALRCAGRKRVSPMRWRNSRVSLENGMCSVISSWPPSSSSAARAKISKVTMVEDGFPGSPKKNLPARPAEHQRLSRLNQYAVKIELRSEPGQHTLDDIVLAGRDAARDQQQIGAETALDELAGVLQLVTSHGQNFRRPACPADLCGQRMHIRVTDLKIPRGFTHWHDFIAGGQNRNARRGIHGNLRLARGRQHAQSAVKSRRLPESSRISPARASEPCGLMNWPGSAGAVHDYAMLLPVGTVSTITTASAPRGNGAPGHDLDRLVHGPSRPRNSRRRALRRSPPARPANRSRGRHTHRAPSAPPRDSRDPPEAFRPVPGRRRASNATLSTGGARRAARTVSKTHWRARSNANAGTRLF